MALATFFSFNFRLLRQVLNKQNIGKKLDLVVWGDIAFIQVCVACDQQVPVDSASTVFRMISWSSDGHSVCVTLPRLCAAADAVGKPTLLSWWWLAGRTACIATHSSHITSDCIISECVVPLSTIQVSRLHQCCLIIHLFTHIMPSVLRCCWLGCRKGIRPVKNWVVRCWRGYLSGARCRLAYGPADATATHCLLLQ